MAEQAKDGGAAFQCAVCDAGPRWRWTDTHGVAQCASCGTPYRIYHYDGDKRVDRPPEIRLKPEFVPMCREYWTSNKRVMPGGHSMGFGHGYEMATIEDAEAFSAWIDQRRREEKRRG
jgi:hypothetical protein